MSTTIQLQKAKSAYAKADQKEKTLLENIFGKKPFQPVVKNQGLSFHQAYPIFMKKKFTDEINLSLQKRKKSDLNTLDKLLILAEVRRGDWVADYDNPQQKKWFIVFVKKASGWVFVVTYCVSTITFTSVGPRFVFETEEAAKRFAEEYIDMHNIVLTNK